MKAWKRIIKTLAGIPNEIARRILRRRFILDHDVSWYDHKTHCYISVKKGFPHDKFTMFPDLRKNNGEPSESSVIHDVGWNRGTFDDGTMLTFDDNNRIMRDVMERENIPPYAVSMVIWGVTLGFMRRMWKKQHGHE